MLSGFPVPFKACVFGASGGIGSAFVAQLSDDPNVKMIHAGARAANASDGKIKSFTFDLTDEVSISTAAAIIGPLDLIIVATGTLHDGLFQPEKSYRAQTADAYARAFAINATGPALIAKHFLPLLPRDRRAIFAVLSARVGSISDNRLGGWLAYRASKAALNMIVRSLAVELVRTHKEAIAVALHPGTVDTELSQPFQRRIAPEKLFTPQLAAAQLLATLSKLGPADSGGLFSWDGTAIPY